MILIQLYYLATSAVNIYNIIKGGYSLYRDVEETKNEYRRHQSATEQYRAAQQLLGNPLTESQYHRYEDEFLVLSKSCILDPYKLKE